MIQAVYETVYLAATLSTTGREQLLDLVATWQAPLRDIQIHGFALLMILGVSQRVFHHFYGEPIRSGHLVGTVLDLYPELLDVFLAFGFRPLTNPWLRRMVAAHTTIERACRLLNVDTQQLLEVLNGARPQSAGPRQPLPVLPAH